MYRITDGYCRLSWSQEEGEMKLGKGGDFGHFLQLWAIFQALRIGIVCCSEIFRKPLDPTFSNPNKMSEIF